MQKHRQSYRLARWDYKNAGYYFVTICTANRRPYFGEIIHGQMFLNTVGEMIKYFWIVLPNHFDNVLTDTFIIMPNHIHGIIQIQCADVADNRTDVADNRTDVAMQRPYSNISPKPKSLSTIIRSYKSIASKTIHLKYPDINFAWQPRFYDHIIRNEKSLHHIRHYILNNPSKWESDEYYYRTDVAGNRTDVADNRTDVAMQRPYR